MQRASHFWERVKRFKRHLSFRTRSASFLKSALYRLRQGKSPVKIIEPLEVLYRRALSIQAWSPPDDLESQIENYSARPTRRPRAIIYTAIIGGHDKLMLPEIINPDYEYVCFSDRPIDGHGVWQIRTVPYIGRDSTRTARFVKTHPFLLLDDADYYVWVDGNIRIVGDIETYFDANDGTIGFIKHPFRESIEEEAQACSRHWKDRQSLIDEQLASYKSEGDVRELQLFETNFFIFPNDNSLHEFFAAWWREIEKFSKRDQLSVGYALKQTRTGFNFLFSQGISVRNHPDFQYFRHVKLRGSPVPKAIKKYSKNKVSAKSKCKLANPSKLDSCDVVICVFNAIDHVKSCLASVLEADDLPNKLIIVNDASAAETASFLRSFAAQHSKLVQLIENEENLGYTRSANKGLLASSADFRLLLNSDTIVTSNWLSKIIRAAESDQKIGIVGPLSNAASFQSLPSIRGTKSQTSVNALPTGVTPNDLDRQCESWSDFSSIAIVPLVHGFCLGIKSETIKKIGVFDDTNFEKYYGEENDFCLRAKQAGFLSVIATDTFVYHAKSKSIAEEERIIWMSRAGNRLREIHGSSEVEHAIRQMKLNPVLIKMRKQAEDFWRKNSSVDPGKEA